MPGWLIAFIVIIVSCVVIGLFILLVYVIASIYKQCSIITPSKKPTKGEYSEKRVDQYLSEFGVLLTNYILNFGHNSSQEIDAILVSNKGVFVIEIKSWAGDIIGFKDDEYWRQFLGRGDIVHDKKNPIKQNEKHCENIRRILKDFNVPVESLIIFDDGDISRICIENVIKTSQIYDYFNLKPDVIEQHKRQQIVQVLYDHKSQISKEEHIKNVKIQQGKNSLHYCPRCGKKILHKSINEGELFYCEDIVGCGYQKLVDKNTDFDR